MKFFPYSNKSLLIRANEKSFKLLRTYILSVPILKSANTPLSLISIFTSKLTFSFLSLLK